MKNTEFYANVKFSDDVEVIDGGQVFGDEEKYEWTVGAYLVSYERNEFRDPFDGIEGKRYALPGEPPHDVLGTKTSHGEPRFIYVEDNQVTVGYYAYEYIEKKLFLDLIVASYPLNDVNKVEWKAISIPEKYEAGAIFVGSSPRNPLCVDGKVYLLGDDYMIACDFKNDQIIEVEDFSKIHELCPDGKITTEWGVCPTLMMGEYEGYIIIEREYFYGNKSNAYYAAFKDEKLVSIIEENYSTMLMSIYDADLKK